MRIIYCNRVGETITRDILPGSKSMVGIRINSILIESREEALKLHTEEGIRWWKNCVLPAFRITPSIDKESNWGSDWVDDGV